MNTIGHYRTLGLLGRGGMGVVYKGHEASLNRYVAIKVLADSLAHDESVKERFLREARSMAALNDPHIISIYYIGDDAGQTYFVMEFVDGESLGSLLKREGKLKPEQAAKIIYQTAQGLSTAHDKGVIHRDIKPGNLMLTSKGAVKIADFGIALSTQDFSKKLTSTGEFVGTPGYLSPEVCQGKPVDQRSDIFSLGIVLFECLAGRMPFTDESPLGLMLEVVKAEIPDVRTLNAEVDPELERILSRMVAKDPAERYQSCQELVADLEKHRAIAGSNATLAALVQPAEIVMPSTTSTHVRQPLAAVSTSDANFRTQPPTRLRSGIAASSPMLRSAPVRATGWGRKAAAGVAATLTLAAGAWALRTELPSLATPAGDTTATSLHDTMATAGAAVATNATPSPDDDYLTSTDRTPNSARGSLAASGDDDTDPDLLDALSSNDAPDDTLDPGNYDYTAAAYATGPGDPPPAYAPVVYYPPYAVPAVPVAYYARSPWRFGFGLSLGWGMGWWGASYYAPSFYAPVVQPAGFAARPLPGTIASGHPVTATLASHPLPSGVAASAATPIANRAVNGTASARPMLAEAQQRVVRQPRNLQAMQARRAAQAQRQEQLREQQQARAEVREERQKELAQRREAQREEHPHPKARRH
ncbi:MAG: serine/threonine protein kinase [Xanthomonadales bacterium PRO7]|nr:serine/threonine protein kinase [Xanthomonadales bacterium PRO7]